MNKVLVIYDSVFGNTEKVAKVIAETLDAQAWCVRSYDIDLYELSKLDLLIIGSPVHGGRPTIAIEQILQLLEKDSLKNVKVAAFDTRFATEDHEIGLQIVMTVIRFAAQRIAKALTAKGGTLIEKPIGFIVEEKEGPLKEGELERARTWAQQIKTALTTISSHSHSI